MAAEHNFDPNNVAGQNHQQRRFPFAEAWAEGRTAPLTVRQIAAMLVEHGRALGRAENSRQLRDRRRQRIRGILDRATAAMRCPHDEATLDDWREGRRLLFSALAEWDAMLEPEEQLAPPFPGDARKLLDQLLAITETPSQHVLRRTGAWLHTAADFIAAVNVALRDTREELQSIRREREAG